ncbi:hypothetical protein [Breznakia pachnodae]|uniref:Uncharacterized protein n=1 Tax=Breznakia pachnodae TaxID=265178 RepID=A0ABU0DZL3_9FIRM|nr:hypothetical protein [Breznakia pachnodae]MDQ0359985.1 hypothetical protein [Breznakia pachnodae]
MKEKLIKIKTILLKIGKRILKYDILGDILFVGIAAIKFIISCLVLKVSIRGLFHIIEMGIAMNDLIEVLIPWSTFFMVIIISLSILQGKGFKETVLKVVTVPLLTFESIFVVVGIFEDITGTGTLDESMTYLLLMLICISIILESLDKYLYKKWLKKTDRKKYDFLFGPSLTSYRAVSIDRNEKNEIHNDEIKKYKFVGKTFYLHLAKVQMIAINISDNVLEMIVFVKKYEDSYCMDYEIKFKNGNTVFIQECLKEKEYKELERYLVAYEND